MFVSVCFSLSVNFCLFFYPSVMSVCLSVSVFVSLSLSVCLSVCLSLSLSLSPPYFLDVYQTGKNEKKKLHYMVLGPFVAIKYLLTAHVQVVYGLYDISVFTDVPFTTTFSQHVFLYLIPMIQSAARSRSVQHLTARSPHLSR